MSPSTSTDSLFPHSCMSLFQRTLHLNIHTKTLPLTHWYTIANSSSFQSI